MAQIVCTRDGRYHVYVMTQGGTEACGVYDTEAEAQEAWRRSEKALNNRKLSHLPASCAIYYAVLVETEELWTVEKLARHLKSGEARLLAAPDSVLPLLRESCVPLGEFSIFSDSTKPLPSTTPSPSASLEVRSDQPVRRIRPLTDPETKT